MQTFQYQSLKYRQAFGLKWKPGSPSGSVHEQEITKVTLPW